MTMMTFTDAFIIGQPDYDDIVVVECSSSFVQNYAVEKPVFTNVSSDVSRR